MVPPAGLGAAPDLPALAQPGPARGAGGAAGGARYRAAGGLAARRRRGRRAERDILRGAGRERGVSRVHRADHPAHPGAAAGDRGGGGRLDRRRGRPGHAAVPAYRARRADPAAIGQVRRGGDLRAGVLPAGQRGVPGHGVILFAVGPVTLLSGTTVSLAEGLLRLLYVTLYVSAGMAALAAIGVAISTLTEHPIGAIAAILVLAVASEVADNVAQFAVIHPYLPTHFWLSFASLLRVPIDGGDLLHGLLSFAVYIVIFCSLAWARFTSADVTS